jgi:hypothetical protein
MSETKPVRRIGSITLGETAYDLAMNGEAILAIESLDIYGRPSAQRVELSDALIELVDWRSLAQHLLNQLALAMIDRDAALARLHKTGEEAK